MYLHSFYMIHEPESVRNHDFLKSTNLVTVFLCENQMVLGLGKAELAPCSSETWRSSARAAPIVLAVVAGVVVRS